MGRANGRVAQRSVFDKDWSTDFTMTTVVRTKETAAGHIWQKFTYDDRDGEIVTLERSEGYFPTADAAMRNAS